MRETNSLPDAVRSFEGVILLLLFWAGIGWFLVNRTPIPNEVFVAGSVGIALLVVRTSLRLLSEADE